MTEMHDADNDFELQRYKQAFPASRVEAITRPGTTPIEARKLIHIDGRKVLIAPSSVQLTLFQVGVEPTRAVERIIPEKLSDPAAQKMLKLQRFPEMLCWRAPRDAPFCILQFCDGVFSHNAFPNPVCTPRCLFF